MEFYNREKELESLAEIKKMSENGGQMTVLTGRRRIGKTALLMKSCSDLKSPIQLRRIANIAKLRVS